MRPEYGGRVELRLVNAEGALARYEVRLFDPETEWSAEVELGDAAPSLGEFAGPERPPEWLEALAKTLLRGTQRQRTSAGSWPRRVTRWRPGPGDKE